MGELFLFALFGYGCFVMGRAGGPSRSAYMDGYEDGFTDASEIVKEELMDTGPRPA